ncbi:tetratricopeptide repeat protein [Streptomyces sp. NPDC102274]|uniref:tetratricopeptide repeat protein n=1 Tax=Streptomyces sp. NPDC102274 TaxID=3366151 RepID=UPI003803ECD1
MPDSRIPTGVRSDAAPFVGPGADGTEQSGTAFGGAGSGGTSSGSRSESGDTAPAGSSRVGLLVSRARAMARSGDLDGALRLLNGADDPEVGGDRDVLDLLARVHAQRGELAEAAACWRRVQEQHPREPAAAAGLARIERLGRRGPRAALTRYRARTALAVAVCAVAAVTVGTVVLIDGADGQSARPGPSQADRVEQLAQRLDADRRAEQAREQDRETARRSEAADALARALRAPGLRPVVRGDSVEVAFTDGLYSEGTQLTPTGAERLAVLGEHLAGREARIEIYGQAATVPGAPRSGGSVVSLWRALIAARELSAASGKPLTAFTTASADQHDAPYASAAKNRTVTVVITPG